MSVKYFEYNTNPNGEKYLEVTMEEFQRDVMETEGRYYISFGTSVLECSYEDYKKNDKEKNHSDYISKDASGKKPVVISFEQYRLEKGQDITEVIEDTNVNVESECYEKYQYELLYKALAQLDEDELELVKSLYWNMLSQREAGECSGETQQSISKKNKAILEKLTNLMNFKK
ncbi:MAG: sigma-70 family RNA polymerase sigma factor [Ruminococcus sp.]|nr:sigma-70 family RNA polymerase sigma factor [Ruminococcus sp.]